MNDRSSGEGAVTGVAKGSLGTGTALEETQEWDLADLQADPNEAAAATVEPVAAVEPVAVVERATKRGAVAVASAAAAPVTRLQPIPPARRASGPSPRSVGIVAAAVLALVGVAAVVTALGTGDAGDAGALPPSAEQPTVAPSVAPPAEESGGKGKDNGGKGNGKGNGNGNGND